MIDENWIRIGKAIISMIPDEEQRPFVNWIADKRESEYYSVAEKINRWLEEWENQSARRLDEGL